MIRKPKIITPLLGALSSLLVAVGPVSAETAGPKRTPPPFLAPPDADLVPKPAPVDKASPWLVLRAVLPGNASAAYLPVAVSATDEGVGFKAASPLRLAALPTPRQPGRFLTVDAMGSGRLAVVQPSQGGESSFDLHFRSVVAGFERRVPLGTEPPAAVHVVGELVYLGVGNRVMVVDFAAQEPKLEMVFQRDLGGFKAYDIFLRAGDRLLAIDDVVMPLYADWFRLRADGRAEHAAGWELPGTINGHYEMGLLVPGESPDDATLIVVAQYGIMSGWGHDLAALPIRGGKLAVPEDVILNAGRSHPFPFVEEHVPRGRTGETTLVAGAEYTSWGGIALGPKGNILAAAGARGLLVLPRDFGPETKARAVDVGGVCTDVVVHEGRVYALVFVPGDEGAIRASLVALEADEASYRIYTQLDLDTPYSGFVK